MKVRMHIFSGRYNTARGVRISFNTDYDDRYYVYEDYVSSYGKNEGNKNLHRRFGKSRIK